MNDNRTEYDTTECAGPAQLPGIIDIPAPTNVFGIDVLNCTSSSFRIWSMHDSCEIKPCGIELITQWDRSEGVKAPNDSVIEIRELGRPRCMAVQEGRQMEDAIEWVFKVEQAHKNVRIVASIYIAQLVPGIMFLDPDKIYKDLGIVFGYKGFAYITPYC